MNIGEEFKIEEVVEKVVKENRDKPLNEIKRIVKGKLRKKDEQLAQKVGIDTIIEIITTKKLLQKNKGRQEKNRGEER